MAWNEVTIMSSRKEFVSLAMQEGANISRLCSRFGISRKTGYKWLHRHGEGADEWARDRSRRPGHSPRRVDREVEIAVVCLRRAHPAWGGRKLRRVLEREGWSDPPSPSTITAILRRHELIPPAASAARGPMQRFERELPNQLWQMDFKSAVRTGAGECHPLTVIDDHSRYSLCVAALPDESKDSVRPALVQCFVNYGLPERMLMDNGSCWGSGASRYTSLGAWLLRLDIGISHGRFYHPQTQGKNERFNRTLKDEALAGRYFVDPEACQRELDRFRYNYNHVRPHDSLQLATPASRYQVSPRPYPEHLPTVEYPEVWVVRKVGPAGYISYRKFRFQVGRAFTGELMGMETTDVDGVWNVYYCRHRVAVIDLRDGSCRQI